MSELKPVQFHVGVVSLDGEWWESPTEEVGTFTGDFNPRESVERQAMKIVGEGGFSLSPKFNLYTTGNHLYRGYLLRTSERTGLESSVSSHKTKAVIEHVIEGGVQNPYSPHDPTRYFLDRALTLMGHSVFSPAQRNAAEEAVREAAREVAHRQNP